MTNNSKIIIEDIWKEYHNQLLLFIKSKVKDEEIANDILQDAFLKISLKIQTLQSDSKLKSWLFQIVRNTISDHYRNKNNQKKLDYYLEEDSEDENKAIRDVENWLINIIETLPEKYKQVLLLSEIQGVSQKELSEQLGISYSGTKSRIQRGRKLLKDKLNLCCQFNVDVYGNVLDRIPRKKNCENC